MAESGEALLKKVYYEDCPGCKQDQRNEMHRGIPIKEFFFIWIVVLCNSLPISSLFPFLYFMIRDFHVAKREEDIGFYAGYVGSAFMIGRALTSVLWGIIADRYGRKPVIIIGTVSVIIFNTLFGLSTTLWMAVSMRFLLGSCNGLLGPIKAYASEVTRQEYQTLGVSVVSTSWGIGLIIGPALGGFLAQPAEKYPSIFSKNSLFGRFPYFLPCLCISLIAIVVAIGSIWLPETLHMHNGKNKEKFTLSDDLEATSNGSDLKEKIEETIESGQVSKGNLFTNWPLISSIIVYCVFSLHDMAYTEIFSLWAVSDRKYGGLSFSSNDVGVVLAISGFGLLVFQIFLYPTVEKIVGPIRVMRLAAALSIPLLSSYPFVAMLSGLSLALVINCASVLKNAFSPQHQRGAANGISMTAMSIFKAIGPGGGGALFSWAQKRQVASFLPGDQMIFFLLNIVELSGLILTFKPFLALPNK
ncbi:protein ZINC INDUCED FACILITATOR-LIKE 1-like isoform X2 [Tasmannia lanceolata]|uniref:protein ZINC INDUCED FACILITATOR-LIKE 1-like isoform X2 n=1 Tax=Tasmannia lanceolata TaxID=3420 RepID=UPI004063D1D8